VPPAANIDLVLPAVSPEEHAQHHGG